MKKRAFTLTEIIITLSVLGIVIATTALSALKIDKIKEKKLETVTNSFNTSVDLALRQILYYDSPKGIKYLTSSELMSYFVNYLDGEHIKKTESDDENTNTDSDKNADADTDANNDTNTDTDTNGDTENKSNEGMTDENGSCADFNGGSSYINADVKCAKFSPDIIAGFYVDSDCSTNLKVKEYKSEELEEREIQNACGYIVYEPRDAIGKFGEDLFVIGLGNRRLK